MIRTNRNNFDIPVIGKSVRACHKGAKEGKTVNWIFGKFEKFRFS